MQFTRCIASIVIPLMAATQYAEAADEPQFKTLAARKAEAEYRRALISAKESYLKELEKVLASALKSGNLDEANAINTTKTAINEDLRALRGVSKDPQSLLAEWEGTWSSGGGTLTLKGNRWVWGKGGGIFSIVGVQGSIAAVDMVNQNTGKTVHAIFQRDGETLHYCGTYGPIRPSEFRGTGTGDPAYFVWKRVKE